MSDASTIDIVAQMRHLAADGSKAERRIAEVVLNDIEYASKASIAELALRAGVSEPTVTRFCRSLACDGMRDFKFRLAQILAIGGLYLFPEPLEREEREARVVNSVYDGAVAALDRVRDSLDVTTINTAAEHLTKARQIIVYGSGGVSSMGAIELQTRLFRFGLAITAHTDGQLQRMTAALAGRDTAIVAISSSGHANSVVQATRIARQYGARTIAITDPTSALAREAELLLPFTIPGDSKVFKPTSGRYSLLMILDILSTVTAEMLGPGVLEGLRRIRTSLSALNMSDSGRPIGD
ncbi:SIS domain-containing protein [Acuticoccus sp. M5D2P5]|uniref:SIS domain-containing protein n=1 Tax=Acuticoccus kalidii TaxID=2910977 RepID=UPI001F2E4C2C|nr:SIS domain-containing protein [Acuticoccus kalidii]MCF3936210.1 SIS domain-containing protein [Acuticoccus kalidii]